MARLYFKGGLKLQSILICLIVLLAVPYGTYRVWGSPRIRRAEKLTAIQDDFRWAESQDQWWKNHGDPEIGKTLTRELRQEIDKASVPRTKVKVYAICLGAGLAAVYVLSLFLPRKLLYNVEYFCADCGNYLGLSPKTCTCGCNRYRTEDTGVGRTIRSG